MAVILFSAHFASLDGWGFCAILSKRNGTRENSPALLPGGPQETITHQEAELTAGWQAIHAERRRLLEMLTAVELEQDALAAARRELEARQGATAVRRAGSPAVALPNESQLSQAKMAAK